MCTDDKMPDDAILAEKLLYDTEWDHNPKQTLMDFFGMCIDPCPEEPTGVWRDLRTEDPVND